MPLMTFPPKPWCVGVFTGGPPVSVQMSTTHPSVCDHLASIWPSVADRAIGAFLPPLSDVGFLPASDQIGDVAGAAEKYQS